MRVAVLGAGFAGGIHAQAWSGIPGADLALVVDADEDRARRLAERWDVAWGTSLDGALGEEIAAVSVCLPTALHEQATVAAARGGKHVLCEKPMALDLAAADRMISVAAEAGVTLMVGHVLRFWPEYEKLRELAVTGALGALRSLACARHVTRPGPYAPWLLDPGQGLGLAEVAIHDIDIAADLIGRPQAIAAQGVRDGGGWRILQALLRFEGESVACVETGWGTPAAEPFVAGFRAFFERGLVEYDSRRRPTFRIVTDDRIEEGDSPAGETEGGPWAFDVAGYLREVEYFAACVAAGRPASRCPPEAGRQALELALTAFEAADSGRELPLP
jgi:UDP-N-acetylglucosamine 3-dehydrogenase